MTWSRQQRAKTRARPTLLFEPTSKSEDDYPDINVRWSKHRPLTVEVERAGMVMFFESPGEAQYVADQLACHVFEAEVG